MRIFHRSAGTSRCRSKCAQAAPPRKPPGVRRSSGCRWSARSAAFQRARNAAGDAAKSGASGGARPKMAVRSRTVPTSSIV
eukprot:11122798-Lingulodinium_polyedra.AAC.1